MTTVEDYMTPTPQFIAVHEGLIAARNLMHRYKVRHLPVLSDGKLAGIVSERDIASARQLTGERSKVLTVEDVMTSKPYTVRLTAPLNQVARTMADRKCSAAVVIDGTAVIGILTTVDALNALADTLEGRYMRGALERITLRPRRGRTRPTARQPR